MASVVTPHMVTVLLNSRKFWRWVLASSFGLPQNGLACTMLMRLDLSSKFTSPTLMLGPVATLSVEGTENSRSLFSHSLKNEWCFRNGFLCQEDSERRNDARSCPSHEPLWIVCVVFRQGETSHILPLSSFK